MGGTGGGFGPGGNAYSGAAGPSHGGDVINHADAIGNVDASELHEISRDDAS